MDLKQSTAVTLSIGPFLDATDGVTPLTGLTLTSADIRLSKNGAAFAAKNDATAPVHLENGNYSCVLNTTDTGTLGNLELQVFATGAVPEFRTYKIMSATGYGLQYETDGDSVVNLKRVNVVNDTVDPALNIQNTGLDGNAVNLNSGSGNSLFLTAAGSDATINVGNTGTGAGLLVTDNITIQGKVGIDGGSGIALELINSSAAPTVYVNNGSTGAASQLKSDSGIALDVDGNGGPAARFQGSTKGIHIVGEAGEGIDIDSAGVGLDITSTGAPAIDLDGSGSSPFIQISGSSNAPLVNISNSGAGGDLSTSEIDAIVAKLPAGTISDLALTDQVDGVTLFNIYELTMAMVNGRFELDTPSAGKITFYKRDNTTILTTVTVSAVNRTRDI